MKSYRDVLDDLSDELSEEEYNKYLCDYGWHTTLLNFKYFRAHYKLPEHLSLLNYFSVEYDDSISDYILEAFNNNLIDINSITNVSAKFYLKIIEKYNFVPSLKILNVDEQTDEICKKSIEYNYTNLLYIENKTDELCFFAISIEPESLKIIHDKSKEFYITAIEKYNVSLSYIQKQDEELCKVAIIKNSENFKHVLPSFKTYELCKFAVNLDFNLLCYVHDELLVDKILDEMLEHKSKEEIKSLFKTFHKQSIKYW